MKYRVCQTSLRTGLTHKGEQLFQKADAQAWADELQARPQNRYLAFWIEAEETR